MDFVHPQHWRGRFRRGEPEEKTQFVGPPINKPTHTHTHTHTCLEGIPFVGVVVFKRRWRLIVLRNMTAEFGCGQTQNSDTKYPASNLCDTQGLRNIDIKLKYPASNLCSAPAFFGYDVLRGSTLEIGWWTQMAMRKTPVPPSEHPNPH